MSAKSGKKVLQPPSLSKLAPLDHIRALYAEADHALASRQENHGRSGSDSHARGTAIVAVRNKAEIQQALVKATALKEGKELGMEKGPNGILMSSTAGLPGAVPAAAPSGPAGPAGVKSAQGPEDVLAESAAATAKTLLQLEVAVITHCKKFNELKSVLVERRARLADLQSQCAALQREVSTCDELASATRILTKGVPHSFDPITGRVTLQEAAEGMTGGLDSQSRRACTPGGGRGRSGSRPGSRVGAGAGGWTASMAGSVADGDDGMEIEEADSDDSSPSPSPSRARTPGGGIGGGGSMLSQGRGQASASRAVSRGSVRMAAGVGGGPSMLTAAEREEIDRTRHLRRSIKNVRRLVARRQFTLAQYAFMENRLQANAQTMDGHLAGLESAIGASRKEAAEVASYASVLDGNKAAVERELSRFTAGLSGVRERERTDLARKATQLEAAAAEEGYRKQREGVRAEMRAELSGDLSAEQEQLLLSTLATKEAAFARLQAERRQREERGAALQEAYGKIKGIIGVSSMAGMADRFLTASSQRASLEAERLDAEARLHAAKDAYERAHREYNDLRASGATGVAAAVALAALGAEAEDLDSDGMRTEEVALRRSIVATRDAVRRGGEGGARLEEILVAIRQGAAGLVQSLQPFSALLGPDAPPLSAPAAQGGSGGDEGGMDPRKLGATALQLLRAADGHLNVLVRMLACGAREYLLHSLACRGLPALVEGESVGVVSPAPSLAPLRPYGSMPDSDLLPILHSLLRQRPADRRVEIAAQVRMIDEEGGTHPCSNPAPLTPPYTTSDPTASFTPGIPGQLLRIVAAVSVRMLASPVPDAGLGSRTGWGMARAESGRADPSPVGSSAMESPHLPHESSVQSLSVSVLSVDSKDKGGGCEDGTAPPDPPPVARQAGPGGTQGRGHWSPWKNTDPQLHGTNVRVKPRKGFDPITGAPEHRGPGGKEEEEEEGAGGCGFVGVGVNQLAADKGPSVFQYERARRRASLGLPMDANGMPEAMLFGGNNAAPELFDPTDPLSAGLRTGLTPSTPWMAAARQAKAARAPATHSSSETEEEGGARAPSLPTGVDGGPSIGGASLPSQGSGVGAGGWTARGGAGEGGATTPRPDRKEKETGEPLLERSAIKELAFAMARFDKARRTAEAAASTPAGRTAIRRAADRRMSLARLISGGTAGPMPEAVGGTGTGSPSPASASAARGSAAVAALPGQSEGKAASRMGMQHGAVATGFAAYITRPRLA